MTMKGWIVAALWGACAAAALGADMSDGDVVAVTFTRERTAVGSTKGTVLRKTNAVINAICSEAGGRKPSAYVLKNTAGESVEVRIESWQNQGATAGKGTVSRRLQPEQGKPFQRVFGTDMVTGSTYGGALNAHIQRQPVSMTIGALTPGQRYDLYLLTGRGNTLWSVPNADTPITYSLSGAENLKAELVGASDKRTEVIDTKLASYERNADDRQASSRCAWSLVKWSFKAGDSGNITISTDADGNLNALALVATSDDPETARNKLIMLGSAGLLCIVIMLILVVVSRRRQHAQSAEG